MHPNEQVLHDLNEAYRAWDLAGLERVLAPDVTYHIPGRSRFAGDWSGRDVVLDLWARQREHMVGQPFRVRFVDILVSDEHVVAVTAGEGHTASTSVETRGANIYRIVDGRIQECWPIYFDIYAFDEFWDGTEGA